MPCSWQKEDYFALLMSTDKKSFSALEMLVDDLHADKEKTVTKFLCHSGSEDFLWGLVHLLGNDTARVAGNAAYILGTLAESEIGCVRVLSLVNQGSGESRKILPHLTRMLTFDDSESVMNAAGTMGTLAESAEGREWILSERCLPQTIDHITALLHSDNLWTASNAALVLARLSISEQGCSRVLEHEHSTHILSKLILSLGVDEAGRGMNAAFAIGRLCDMDQGRKRLLQLNDSERMISALAKMLCCDDTGASKNSCFALSCLATNAEGHSRLLGNVHSEDILKTLASLLCAEDSETGWFAAMTLRTLAKDINPDLKEEAIITLEILKRLSKPSPPNVIGSKCVYTGKQCECEISGLTPNTPYTYKLRAYTDGDESPFSDIVAALTEEDVPGPPQSVRILGTTITQLKVGWDPPAEINGALKGYYVFLDDKEVQHTTDTSVILTGLTANTSYELEVCAATSKGRGDRAGIIGTTAEMGAHAPSKPHVNVVGRNELYISWGPPEQRGGTGKERVKSSTAPVENRPPSVSSTVSIQDHTLNLPASTRPPEKSKSPSPLPSPVQKSPALESTPSPRVQRPVAEIKMESPPPKPKTPRATTRPERGSTSAGIQPRAVLSTVSMQNNNKQENNGESGKPMEATVSGTKIVSKNAPIQNNLGKMERSKTTMNGGREYRKGKYSGSVQNRGERNDSDVKGSMELPEASRTRERSRPNTNDREHNTMSVSSNRKSKQEVEHYSSNTCTVHDTDRVEKDKFCFTTPDISRERSSKVKGHGVSRTSADRSKGSKDAVLPKPLPPSQQYLMDAGNTYGDKSSPQSKAESDWLSQVKSVSDNLSRPPQAQLPVFHESADSTYFIDQSQYLQRTNTYVSSHRHQILEPIRKKDYPTHPALGNAAHPVLSPIQEHIPNVLRRYKPIKPFVVRREDDSRLVHAICRRTTDICFLIN
ncbi:DSCL-like protein [Mya arenaria]|uniref:DSCL-like protein n=1 Tax=Mya arenaria TaxID=6604 RepID=A0ABY7GIT3_MYAAR|nr:DSCL-like protein [Mya arenaria]